MSGRCNGVCGGEARWECTECVLWKQRYGSGGMPSSANCASSACSAQHDNEMRGHPAHRWKDLARTDHEGYMRQVFGRGGPQKPEHEKRAEDESMLRAWTEARRRRLGLRAAL